MPSVTFTFLSATDTQIKYLLTSDGGATGLLTAATMVGDAVPGSKLAALLGATYASNGAATAFVFGEDIVVSILPGPDHATFKSWALDASANANALRLALTCEGEDVNGSVLTINYLHTMER